MEEIWKDIPGYEGKYQASTQGRIKALSRVIHRVSQWGHPWLTNQKERIKKLGRHDCGYLNVSLDSKTKFVHRIIGLTFLGDPGKKMDINHKNGIKDDNRIENLEWCTRSRNIIHAIEIGLIVPTRGNNNPGTKITTNKVRQVLELLQAGYGHNAVAKIMGISNCTVSKIRNKKSWHCTAIDYDALPVNK